MIKSTQQPAAPFVNLVHAPDSGSHGTKPAYRLNAAQVLLGVLAWVCCIAFVIAVYRQF